MYIKKFLLSAVMLMLAACGGGLKSGGNWGAGYDATPTANPSNIARDLNYSEYGLYGTMPDGYSPATDDIKTVSVLLPLSGPNSDIGQSLQHAIEIAFIQRQPRNIIVAFNDLSGTSAQKSETIDAVLAKQPDMIIGPVFADDVRLLQRAKPDGLPVLAFTSDWTALGGGLQTMAVLPYQGAESIVSRMAGDGRANVLVLAPDTISGYAMANAATNAIGAYGMTTVGLMFYEEGNTDSMKRPHHAVQCISHDAMRMIVLNRYCPTYFGMKN